MAKINCPECRKIISDKEDYCPECGFALVDFRDPDQSYDDDDKSYAFFSEDEPVLKNPDETILSYIEKDRQSANSFETEKSKLQQSQDSVTVMIDEKNKQKSEFRKKRRVYAAIASVCLALCVCVGVIMSVIIKHQENNEEISGYDDNYSENSMDESTKMNRAEVNKIVLESVSYKENYYTISLESDSKEEFIAVVTDRDIYTDKYIQKYLVYMKDGKGSIDAYSLTDITPDDAMKRIKIDGYIDGYKLKASDVHTYSYCKQPLLSGIELYSETSGLSDNAMFDQYLEIGMEEGESGLLFYEYKPSRDEKDKTYGYCSVYYGQGLIEAKSTEDAEPYFKPLFFVSCKLYDSSNCSRDYLEMLHDTYKKNEYRKQSYTKCELDASFTFVAGTPDIVLYTYQIGFDDMDKFIFKSGFEFMNGKTYSVKTYDLVEGDDIGDNISYSVETIGGIDVIKL